MVTTVGRLPGRLATSLGELGETLGAFSGDFPGESLWRLFKVLWGSRHMLLGGFSDERLGELVGRRTKSSGSLSRSWGEHSWLTSWGGAWGSRSRSLGHLDKYVQGSWRQAQEVLGRLTWASVGNSCKVCGGILLRSLENPGEVLVAKCFGNLGHILGPISGDCLGESLERSCKMRCGSRNVLWGVLWRFHTKSLGVLDKSLGDSSGNVIKLLGCPGQARKAFLGS